MKFLGLEVNCGCDARRAKLLTWWNAQDERTKSAMKGTSRKLFGWIYTFDEDGNVTAEKAAKDATKAK